jgi:uncharacterized protein (UPF0332 family)
VTGGASGDEVWITALDFLSEAESIPAATVPRMAIHAAYYAMFHGARAVLLRIGGPGVPTKHGAVVNRFGYYAKQANDPDLMAAGRAWNHMQDERERSDYDTESRPAPDDAAMAIKEARTFLETCARLHGLPLP